LRSIESVVTGAVSHRARLSDPATDPAVTPRRAPGMAGSVPTLDRR